ncbi:MAG TPA: squalene synthase HpnC [Candidatus Poseidoniales archaeon]|jgi:squalene synthase HpnC|nr:MAG: squalene synthase HpnC [Euryarchaeota archaeon]HIF45511.1 squalene synthase HpnC [Candidatus Poseidoniales archaeon]HIL64757.1 squalene synthase HpnC [Candidatus Poseidoniales archaeon]
MSEKFEWGDHCLEPIHLAGWGEHQSTTEAQAYCSSIANAHYENFIIVNKFTPKDIKQHIENIYAFCRYGDDLGDEAPFDTTGRMALLQAWEDDLEEAAKDGWSGSPAHPILKAIQITSKQFNIPLEPYWKLIQAFKMDQNKTRYSTWEELKQYCSFSADPVGHLFLYVYGHDDEELRQISDNTCTALQLANHWQDISRDWTQDRSYIPQETLEKFGINWEQYDKCVATDSWREMLSFEVDRAQRLFDAGKDLWPRVNPHLAVDLMMFTKGGEAILKSIRKQRFDTWTKRPKVSKIQQAILFFKAKRAWSRAAKSARRA